MARYRLTWRHSYRKMTIAAAIDLLYRYSDPSSTDHIGTHVTMSVSRFDAVPPKAKPKTREIEGGGIAGRIHLQDACTGKVRRLKE